MSILRPKQILDLHAAAISTRVAPDRSLLIARLPPPLVNGLPAASTPSAQILSDLLQLNSIEQLVDGSVPLETWIENAIPLFEGGEKAVFQGALEAARLHRKSSG